MKQDTRRHAFRDAKLLQFTNGPPGNNEGSDGSMWAARIEGGLAMYVKDSGTWFRVGGDAISSQTSQVSSDDASSGVTVLGSFGGGGTTASTGDDPVHTLTSDTITITGENPMNGTSTTDFEVDGTVGAFDGTAMQNGTATTGLLGLANSVTVSATIVDIDNILEKLAPPKSPNLSQITMSTSGVSLSIGTTYTAKKAGGTTSVSNVSTDTTPHLIVDPNGAGSDPDGFHDAGAGTLTGYYSADNGGNWTTGGQVTFTTQGSSSNAGNDLNVNNTANNINVKITGDYDPHYGVEGKANFWESGEAEVSYETFSSGNESYVGKKFKITHSATGTLTSDTFYYDTPDAESVTNLTNSCITSYPTAGADIRERHGVMALDGSGSFGIAWEVNNTITKFYHNTSIGRSKIDGWNADVSTTHSGDGTAEGGDYTLARSVSKKSGYTPHAGKSAFGTRFKVYGYARGFTGSESSDTYTPDDVYIDGYSDKSNRRNAGKTQYPGYGSNTTTQYGGATFNMGTVLGTANFYELMQFGNYVQWPDKDFEWIAHPDNTENAGSIDYSGITSGTNIDSDNYRWFCKKFTGMSSASGFTLEINGDSGISGSPHDPNLKIYAIVQGVTNWMDCNTSPGYQPGDPIPGTVADGDLCVLDASSDKDTKVCTFGTTRTGDLYIRIGLQNSIDKFTDITITFQ